ncbi:hypothetical protein K469DRAFT_1813 [Zopfia rhizophila CBS 207.26]|uniref:Uncharacterized protein n=1 Tax=Zopfia rhizophila CBS 207.26 TaxID=1314779 RepID=A0A6A6EXX8_9PEZI|nr:hypothetical protein K469DRAFT_340789 [Zopfia rhizophila CBS 207.26]KAF2194990.1 hypothetical protein K469DRAFT_1813 [Zopfia rhizophila CBS 207.26]
MVKGCPFLNYRPSHCIFVSISTILNTFSTVLHKRQSYSFMFVDLPQDNHKLYTSSSLDGTQSRNGSYTLTYSMCQFSYVLWFQELDS